MIINNYKLGEIKLALRILIIKIIKIIKRKLILLIKRYKIIDIKYNRNNNQLIN